MYFRANSQLCLKCPSQAKWSSPWRTLKVSPAPLGSSGTKWQGNLRFSLAENCSLGWPGGRPLGVCSAASRFQEAEVDGEAEKHDSEQEKTPLQLQGAWRSPPIQSRVHSTQVWYHCDGDFSGFQVRLNWIRLPPYYHLIIGVSDLSGSVVRRRSTCSTSCQLTSKPCLLAKIKQRWEEGNMPLKEDYGILRLPLDR